MTCRESMVSCPMRIPINYQNETGKHFDSVKVIKIEKELLLPADGRQLRVLHVETISKYQPTFLMEEEKLNEEYPEWRELIAK